MSTLRVRSAPDLIARLFEEARRAMLSRNERAVVDEVALAATLLAGMDPAMRRAAIAALVELERAGDEERRKDVFLVD
ncbi:hypothetical protein [Salinarimonas rosea]|uniref:hypothetical protein n=1 Tax=Salinarimonas rosea TaxID=552063 RepID=UPI0003FEA9D9|nr:hypothetical protein [Salinarimonas rosea]